MSIQIFKKELNIGLHHPYRIMHISDVHLTCKDDLSSEEEAKRADKRTADWVTTRKDFAKGFGEICEAEHNIPAQQQLMDLLSYTEENKADALLISGDLVDFYSSANMRFVQRMLEDLTIPYMWVCGNHEAHKENYPDYAPFMRMDPSFQVIEQEDFLIVGIDNGQREISPYQLERLKALFAKDKPILLVMHVPIKTKGNAALLQSKCGPYFMLNYEGCSDTTTEFCELLCSGRTPVRAIFTGHLHFENVSEFAPGKYQFGASQALIGFINDFTIN